MAPHIHPSELDLSTRVDNNEDGAPRPLVRLPAATADMPLRTRGLEGFFTLLAMLLGASAESVVGVDIASLV